MGSGVSFVSSSTPRILATARLQNLKQEERSPGLAGAWAVLPCGRSSGRAAHSLSAFCFWFGAEHCLVLALGHPLADLLFPLFCSVQPARTRYGWARCRAGVAMQNTVGHTGKARSGLCIWRFGQTVSNARSTEVRLRTFSPSMRRLPSSVVSRRCRRWRLGGLFSVAVH